MALPQAQFKVGDLVLVATELGAKNDWQLGRISATYPGADGLVKNLNVTTNKGELHRDVRKVCLLEGFNE